MKTCAFQITISSTNSSLQKATEVINAMQDKENDAKPSSHGKCGVTCWCFTFLFFSQSLRLPCVHCDIYKNTE